MFTTGQRPNPRLQSPSYGLNDCCNMLPILNSACKKMSATVGWFMVPGMDGRTWLIARRRRPAAVWGPEFVEAATFNRAARSPKERLHCGPPPRSSGWTSWTTRSGRQKQRSCWQPLALAAVGRKAQGNQAPAERKGAVDAPAFRQGTAHCSGAYEAQIDTPLSSVSRFDDVRTSLGGIG